MEKKTNLIPLEKDTESTFTMTIPLEVEQKIRHLCNKISHIEWSGILFYTVSGTYEDSNLDIRCVDIFPMDIGNSTYTEFSMSPEVINYMTTHPELLKEGVYQGLIHSHHSMSTFFSGTDTSTLQSEGDNRNHFVSLIVNNAGLYTAAITRKLKMVSEVKTTYTYNSFEDVEKAGEDSYSVEEEKIEYSMLKIIKEGIEEDMFSEMDKRLTEIKSNKEKAKSIYTPYNTPYNTSQKKDTEYSTFKTPSLFDDNFDSKYIMESEPPREYSYKRNSDLKDIKISKTLVDTILKQLLTGSITISSNSKLDLSKWADQMVSLYDNRFNKNLSNFGMWVDTFGEYILANAVPKECQHYEDIWISALCEEIVASLRQLPQNKYIKEIINYLLLWIL